MDRVSMYIPGIPQHKRHRRLCVCACVCTQICRQGDQLVFEGSNGKPTASKIRPANCVGGPDAYTIPYVRYCKRNPEANHLVWFASDVRNDHRRLSPVSAKTSIIIVDVVVKRRILTSTEEAFRCDWLAHVVSARAHGSCQVTSRLCFLINLPV